MIEYHQPVGSATKGATQSSFIIFTVSAWYWYCRSLRLSVTIIVVILLLHEVLSGTATAQCPRSYSGLSRPSQIDIFRLILDTSSHQRRSLSQATFSPCLWWRRWSGRRSTASSTRSSTWCRSSSPSGWGSTPASASRRSSASWQGWAPILQLLSISSYPLSCS